MGEFKPSFNNINEESVKFHEVNFVREYGPSNYTNRPNETRSKNVVEPGYNENSFPIGLKAAEIWTPANLMEEQAIKALESKELSADGIYGLYEQIRKIHEKGSGHGEENEKIMREALLKNNWDMILYTFKLFDELPPNIKNEFIKYCKDNSYKLESIVRHIMQSKERFDENDSQTKWELDDSGYFNRFVDLLHFTATEKDKILRSQKPKEKEKNQINNIEFHEVSLVRKYGPSNFENRQEEQRSINVVEPGYNKNGNPNGEKAALIWTPTALMEEQAMQALESKELSPDSIYGLRNEIYKIKNNEKDLENLVLKDNWELVLYALKLFDNLPNNTKEDFIKSQARNINDSINHVKHEKMCFDNPKYKVELNDNYSFNTFLEILYVTAVETDRIMRNKNQ